MRPKDRKLCKTEGCMRRRVFIYRGRVRMDKHHELCDKHYRSQIDQLRSRIHKDGSQVRPYAPRQASMEVLIYGTMAEALAR